MQARIELLDRMRALEVLLCSPNSAYGASTKQHTRGNARPRAYKLARALTHARSALAHATGARACVQDEERRVNELQRQHAAVLSEIHHSLSEPR